MEHNFVHLHVHTQYSLLDGASNIANLVGYAKELGMKALAITDHGVMYGVIEFYKECEKQGIKPIIGCEVYVAPRKLTDKDKTLDKRRYHLILLAKDLEGYHNLIKLVSVAELEGFYTKPRVDKEVLRKYSKGLICLSACIQGEVPRKILDNDVAGAEEALLEYMDIFGKENYFIEIQNHDLEEERTANKELIRLAQKHGLGLVATNDAHYVRRADSVGQDVLLCLQTQAMYSDPNRMRFNNDMYYVKSRKEMEERFPEQLDALDNTEKIADMCDVKLEFGHLLLPKFPLPEGISEKDKLRELCEEGFKTRYAADDAKARERLEYELGIIEKMGYPGYFLIVWDFINYCRENDIPVGPGRGSAAGSIVAYLTGITNIDPLKYNLIFERFLNPERISMPDIDTDICYVKRHLVVDYLAKKYGENHVAQIITFGTLKAKAAIKDVGRALEVPLNVVKEVNKTIPNGFGITLQNELDTNKDLKALCESDPNIARMIEIAKTVEGMPRNSSTHAAGVIITPTELTDYVPLQLTSSSVDGQEYICTQYDKDRAESLGLLKMDLLGLRTLTVIDDAVKMIKTNHNIDIKIDDIDLHDKKTCQMLCDGDTAAVFQMESEGMTKLMVDLAPEGFEDLIPLVALYRPGPLGSGMGTDFINGRHGKVTAKILHPLMEPILADTYGVILYQEQVMQITSVLAGFTLGEADILRRAMGHKKPEELARMRSRFVEGAEKTNNIPQKLAEQIFDLLEHFAGYGFNKSHSAAYAYVAFQTAYLKANYPREYMAAFLNSFIDTAEKVSLYINICRNNMGIKILPPDVNHSGSHFSVDGDAIRFGLSAIKNVGEAAVSNIVEVRKEDGPFKDFADFAQRVDASKVNKRVVENLIKCGAMDNFGLKRSQLLAVMEDVLALAASRQKDAISGQIGLFGEEVMNQSTEIMYPQLEEIPRKELLTLERELTGFYITGHPLEEYSNTLKNFKPVVDLTEDNYSDESFVAVAGIINGNKIRATKRGDTMANFILEDLSGRINVIAFPKCYSNYSGAIIEDQIVKVQGVLKLDEEVPRIFANSVEKLSKDDRPNVVQNFKQKAPVQEGAKVNVYVAANLETPEITKKLASIFFKFSGSSPVFLHLLGSKKIIKTEKRFWVDGENSDFKKAVQELLGEKAIT